MFMPGVTGSLVLEAVNNESEKSIIVTGLLARDDGWIL